MGLLDNFVFGKTGLLDSGSLLSTVQNPLAAMVAQQQAQMQASQAIPAPQAMSPSVPVSTPAAPSGGSGAGGGGIGSALAGQDDPSLTPEQNASIKRQAILNAGLAMLMSDKPGLGGVAEGALLGQQFGARERDIAVQDALARRAQRVEQDKLDLRREVLSRVDTNDPAAVRQAMFILAGEDDQEGLSALVDIAESTPADQIVQGQRGQILHFNPVTRELTEMQTPEELPRDTAFVDRGTSIELVDEGTGELIKSWSKGRFESASELRSVMQQELTNTRKLANDFFAQTKDYQEAWRQARLALNAPATGAGDQTLVVAFNKLLDAGSVVREGEFDRVYGIGGLRARFGNALNKVLAGGELHSVTRQQLLDEVQRLSSALDEDIQIFAQPFTEQATAFGLNPEWVTGTVTNRVRREAQADVPAPGVPASVVDGLSGPPPVN